MTFHRYRRFQCAPELLLAMCEFLSADARERKFSIFENGLPKGCKFIRAFVDEMNGGMLNLVIEHPSFDEVPEGNPIPVLPHTVINVRYIDENDPR
jgi:hypothetical protein